MGATALAALVPLSVSPASSAASSAATAPDTDGPAARVPLVDHHGGLADKDVRGAVPPTAGQRAAVTALAADVRWNDFGTPASLLPRDGLLAGPAAGSPVDVARSWLRDHAAVFGLSAAQVDGLELVNSQRLADSPARAVLLRQRFGGLEPALGGLVTVGVAGDGSVAYVSSSLSRDTSAPADAVLSPVQGWLKAAADVGRPVADELVDDILSEVAAGWHRLTVPGFAQEQQVRLRALPMPGEGVRPVLEANVVDVAGGHAQAHTCSSTPSAARCSSGTTGSTTAPTPSRSAAPSPPPSAGRRTPSSSPTTSPGRSTWWRPPSRPTTSS